MDQNEIKALFAIIRSAIEGNRCILDEKQKEYIHSSLINLLKASLKHDIVHLLVFGLKNNNLLPKENKDLEKYILKAVFRYEGLRFEYENLCATFERSKIPFLPLKGSVIRGCYPEPWMRTSCDIDVLLRKEDLEKAKSILISECGYTHHEAGAHDVSFFTSSGMHVELHYGLIEDGRVNDASNVLQNVWSDARVRQGFDYWFEMSDEMYYFYHIAHMAKHFADGGCGIRPFIDIYILDGIHIENKEKRDLLLSQGGLLKFADAVRKTSRVWFGKDEHDSVTIQMEDYILRGGVYGNNENRITLQQQKRGGRIKYALSKIFIPYDVIKFHYPILQKHRWLTPFMEVRRWCKLIFFGHLRRTTKELRYSNSISSENASSMQAFLEDIGL